MSKINQRQNAVTRLIQAPPDSFKLIFESAPTALVEGVWKQTFDVGHVNAAAIALFGAQNKEQFAAGFNFILGKIPKKVLLDLLSARVKGDVFEAELRLPTFQKQFVHVFMRLAYLPSGHNGHTQHAIVAFHDITPYKRREGLLKKLSQIDGLTGTLNQRTVLQRLEEELSRAKRYELHLSCVILDMDHFKRVNDTLGHLKGDRCLKQAAEILRSNLRKTDVIGRYGGDEFLVILPETSAAQAVIPVERFLKHYQSFRNIKHKDQSVQTGFSIGISDFPQDGIDSVKDLIRAADQALYLSKSSGGNCHRIYQKT